MVPRNNKAMVPKNNKAMVQIKVAKMKEAMVRIKNERTNGAKK